MKIGSTILVLILAVAGLSAMVIDARQEPSRKTLRFQSQRLAATSQLPVDEIARITLKRAGETPLIFERTGPNWIQVQPFAYPMDPFSMRQFAVLARELEMVGSLSPADLHDSQSLESVSLQPAAAEITFEWPGGSRVLQLGRRSAAGRAYLRVGGDETIYIVSTKLHERAIDMDLHEWRDRNIFHNVGVESSRIEWQNGPSRLVLARERKQWKMLEPAATRVDPVGRDAYLQMLSAAKLGTFVLDLPSASDLAKFGLSTPAVTLTITTPSVGAPADAPPDVQKLLIGSRASANTQDRFAMIDGHPVVFRITRAALEALFRQPRDLAEPTGTGVPPADVKSIVIRKGGEELKLERDMEKWRAPDRGNVEVNAAFVQELLDQLTKLRAPNVEFKPYPREAELALITLHGFNEVALDTIRIAQEKDSAGVGGRWIMEDGDNVLRLFPASLKIRMTAADFGL
jgi:hypothetical protein